MGAGMVFAATVLLDYLTQGWANFPGSTEKTPSFTVENLRFPAISIRYAAW